MKLKRMKQQLRGAFTVAAPQKRLRMWTGIPIMFGASALSQFYKQKTKSLVTEDHPYQGAALQAAAPALVGAVLTAIPYTRWAGALVLGWSVLGGLVAGYTYGTDAGRSAVAMMGARPPVSILRG
jgi:hypothetical protein